MDRIDSMGVIAGVAAKQSFSGAARELHLSRAVVSKHVRALEDWLSAQLLNRTTRRLNVTEIGALVYARCEHILDTATESSKAPARCKPRPRGACHTCGNPDGITQFGLALADCMSGYPDVAVEPHAR